jgi:hypothetical protein
MIDLTPEETAQILKQREVRAPPPDKQRDDLLARMEALHANQLTQGFGFLPRNIDEGTLKLVEAVQRLGFGAKNQYGDVQPFIFPTRLAYEVVRLLRGDPKPKVVTGDIKVPSA